MNKETLTALKDSIEHWRRMKKGGGALRRNEAPNADHCALCRLFIRNHCIGCPVFSKTGARVCGHTPYQWADEAWAIYGPDSGQFKAAAGKQIKFLVSLLPKPKPRKTKTTK